MSGQSQAVVGRACWRDLWRDREAAARLVLFALIGVLATWIGFKMFSAKAAGELIKEWGYYGIAGTFVWWVVVGVKSIACPGWRSGFAKESEGWQMAGLTLALTAVAVLTTPYAYKILFDEAVIQSTAWNMHMEREVGALGRAYEVEGLLRSLQTYLDKRPYFFPFLVSLVHDITGYRALNAHLLNTALMPVCLGLIYILGRRLAGHRAGLVALASLGGFSLLAVNATGAGLEMLNLAMILLAIWAAARYLEAPDDLRLGFFLLTVILLAGTRYESSLYVGCGAGVAVVGWWRERRIRLPWAALAAPLLLIPCALHNTYLSGTPVLWELRDGYEVRFSCHYLIANLGFAREYFFNLAPGIANSIWLTVAGGGSVCALLWRALVRRRQELALSATGLAIFLIGLGVLGNLALLMAYYWGDLSDPVVSRLSLPFQALLALAIAAALGQVSVPWQTRAAGGALVVALACYLGFGLPVNWRLAGLNTTETAQRWEERVVAARGPATRMVLTDKSPLSWFVREVGATTIERGILRKEALAFHLRHHSYQEILVTQTLVPTSAEGDLRVAQADVLPPEFVLEPVAERRIGSGLHRISILREIKVDVPSAPEVTSVSAP